MRVGKVVTGLVMVLLLLTAVSLSSFTHSSAKSLDKVVAIDGSKANTNKQSMYRGMGMVSGNGSSRLMLDYKDENPDQYWEIMNYLFNTETGMGLSHIKVEMGTDVNSSSGTEASIKRTENEVADATRGAGYQFAADAKKINPNITMDMLNWGEPLWVFKAKNVYAARYKWYKETLDAAYNKYGLKFDYVSANRNERYYDTKWIIYLSKALKKEKNCPYDYSKIKIVAADEVCTWDIADEMLKNKDLMNAIDVLGSHYTSWSSANAKKLNEKYGKELWLSEGSSPMSYSKGTYKYDGNGSGIGDINGMLDIATRIITMYPGGSMNLYEFQPAVASYYDGSSFFPKQLITANEPWSGYYTLDPGFYMAMHFSQFSKVGWQYIKGACKGDGKAGGDGHAIVDSTYNYQTVADPKTGDYSIVIANNTAKPLLYTFNVSNLAKKSEAVDVWETRGPDDDTNYYQNYLKKIDTITPQKKNTDTYTYQVKIKPYSLVTVSTLKVDEKSYSTSKESKVLNLPYSDDFEYKNYDQTYLADRGYAPRYTTDEGGAFEVTKLNENNVIQQKVTYKNKADDWGNTPDPVTNLGDDTWTNYSVSVDALFSPKTIYKSKDEKNLNYVGVGARYNLGSSGKSGYWLQLLEDGNYKLNKNSQVLYSSKTPLKGFDRKNWYNLKLTVNDNMITAYINNNQVTTYKEKKTIISSGRVALYSDFNSNYFDNLKVDAIPGKTSYSKRIDNTDSPITYGGTWQHFNMGSFICYNRTITTGSKGATLSFDYSGEGFAIIGEYSKGVKLEVEVDGKVEEKVYKTADSSSREAAYYNYNLEQGSHKVKITIKSGKFSVDAVEVVNNSTDKLFTK